MSEVEQTGRAPAPCQHIADYYQQRWENHHCIGFNILRHGYRQWAEGRPCDANNLFAIPDAIGGSAQ